jgi:hypothetical protein
LLTHPLVKLARSVQRTAEGVVDLPLQMRAVRLDINYAFAGFDSGPKTEANFRKMELTVEKLKLRLESIRLKIERAQDRIDSAHNSLSDFDTQSERDRRLIADFRIQFHTLAANLAAWSNEIDDALEESDLILANFALEVRT